jgi:uncharacterized membrane-anchored protein
MRYWRQALLWVGLLLALIVVNRGIAQREAILSDGRVLLLELAPVDPRSLMQGDYMALRFAAAEDIYNALDPACKQASDGNPGGNAAALRCLPERLSFDGPVPNAYRDGYAVFTLEPNGVGRFVRIQDASVPVESNRIAVRYRDRAWRDIRIASNAWFFPEGQGERYAVARYGELRVAADGTALLTGLRDEKRKPL